MRSGNTPLDAAQCLVRSAMLAAKGMIIVSDPEPCAVDPDGDSRFTVLDPLRPARCLLECLTRAVQICAIVFAEHCEPTGDGDWTELTRISSTRPSGPRLREQQAGCWSRPTERPQM